MTNKVVRQVSKWANCVVEKSKFLKENFNRKTGSNKMDPKLLIY